MALSRDIEEINIAVLDITQYELVPAPEFPGTARYTSITGDGVRACVATLLAVSWAHLSGPILYLASLYGVPLVIDDWLDWNGLCYLP